MKILSIIIRGNEDKIKNNIDLLSSIINEFDSEIIVISNSIKKIDIPFEYQITNFHGNFKSFLEFCFASSTGGKVMIIDDNISLNQNAVNEMEQYLKGNDYRNLSYNIRYFINKEKSMSFMVEDTAIYNRGIKGFNKCADTLIESSVLTDCSICDMKWNIDKLIYNNHINELFLWYENFISGSSESVKADFCTYLEEIKSNSPASYRITDTFLNSGLNDKYTEYLKAMNCGEMKLPVNFKLSGNDMYYSWYLDSIIKHKRDINIFFDSMEDEMQNSMVMYLLKNDSSFSSYLYDFIFEKCNNNSHYRVLLKLMRLYMKYFNESPDIYAVKNKVINIFMKFTDILNDVYPDINTELNIDEAFIKKFNHAKTLIEKNFINEAVNILEMLFVEYTDYQKLLLFLIQKLRCDYNIYQYKLSVCMIVKDESKNIERCLSSLKLLTESKIAEIIILDTGSKDGTPEIAKCFTPNVYFHDWQGNFSESRNYCSMFAKGSYIFTMDADEEFESAEMQKLIEEFNSSDYKKYNTFTLRLISYTDASHNQSALLTQPRIFKNDGSFYYSSTVHNQPVLKLPIKNLDINVLHYGYIMTNEIREKKYRRTATLLKNELQRNPRSIYFRFQLSTSYAMYGDIKKALHEVEIYMRLIKEEDIKDDVILMYYNNAASIYINSYKFSEALNVCSKALKINPYFIDFIYYRTMISFYDAKYMDTIRYANEYLDLIGRFNNLDIANDGRFSFYSLDYRDDVLKMYVISSYNVKNFEECIDKTLLIKDVPVLKNCLYEIIQSCFETERFDVLNAIYDKVKEYNDKEAVNVFDYFICEISSNAKPKTKDIFNSSFNDKKFLRKLNTRLFKKSNNILSIINIYDFDNMDFESFWLYIGKVMPVLISFNIKKCRSFSKLKEMKHVGELILHREESIREYGMMSDDEIVDVFQKYMHICSTAVKKQKIDILEPKERLFIAKILDAFDKIKCGDIKGFSASMKDASSYYYEMKGISEFIVDVMLKELNMNETKDEDKPDEKMMLKSKIALLADAGNTDEMLKVFDNLNCNIDDDELISFKSGALILNNRLAEAKETLDRGLTLFPDNINILKNLYDFYLIKSNNEKCVEIMSRIKMLSESEHVLKEEYVISQYNSIKKSNVLLGTMDFSFKTIETAGALKNKNISAAVLNYSPQVTRYAEDYVMNVNSFDNGSEIMSRTTGGAAGLISMFDIFHFFYGTSLTFDHRDLKVIKSFDKKILMSFFGQDVRISSIADKFNSGIKIDAARDDIIKKKLELFSKYTDCCIVCNDEIYEYVKNYFNNIVKIPLMLDLKKIVPKYENEYEKSFVIVHAPVSRENKGTKYISEAVESLKQKYNIDYRIIEGTPHRTAMKMYRDADLIIDQVISGNYGMLSIEGMALGKPVICFISDFMKEKYPEELPIISADMNTVKDKIEYLIKNRDILKEIGIAGRKYAEKYHDVNVRIKDLIKLYKV